MKIGCTRCPYAGHIELKECIDAYTEISQYCGMYNHNELYNEPKKRRRKMITIQLRDKNLIENMKDIETLREFLSDEEIQRMYDEQVKKDNK